MYSVKEAARILDVSTHAIRYYDDCGLIPGVERGDDNQRLFSDDALEWIFVSLSEHKVDYYGKLLYGA